MWKRILVPHDFSELGATALHGATELARACDAELVLLHVTDLAGWIAEDVTITPEGETTPVRVDEYTEEGARRWLERLAVALRPVVRARCEVAFGDVGEQILEVAEKWEVDAIVMGTHGRTGLLHLVLGSVAEYVLRRATVPVVTYRRKAPEARRTREELAVEDELAG